MKTTLIRLSIAVMAFSSIAYAQESDQLETKKLEEVEVSSTKFSLEKEKSGKIITMITAAELEKQQGQSLATILSQVAGVDVNGNQSSNGKNQAIYIRGGRNRQVAIYVDGVPVNDASAINSEFDIRLIGVNQIEKIEILKGSSSVLYGSGAATGVINITLKKASKNDINGAAYLIVGTQNDVNKKDIDANDFNQGFSVNGTLGKVSYVTSLNSVETRGFSEAAGVNYEEDLFSRINVMQKIAFKASDKLNFDFLASMDRFKNTFDNGFGGVGFNNDDLNNSGLSEQYRIAFSPKYIYDKGELVINSGLSRSTRNLNLTNSFAGTVDVYNYASRTANVDVFNRYNVTDELFVVLGTQFQYFDMVQLDAFTDIKRENTKFNLVDPYATVVFNSDFGLNFNLGARYNTHSEYGSQLVYNINPSYTFSNIPLRVLASYSTAYITPSLYQLYGPYGNLTLTPEENATVEVGFETSLLDKKLTLNAVGFYRDEENTFGFFFDSTTFESFYVNNKITNIAKGIETAVAYKFNDNFALNGNYTFTQVEKNYNLLVAKHRVNLNADVKLGSKLNAHVAYQFVDKRDSAYFDNASFTSEQVSLKAYKLVSTNLNYSISKNLSLIGSVTNIFNEDFNEVIGYNTRGRNYKLGVNFMF